MVTDNASNCWVFPLVTKHLWYSAPPWNFRNVLVNLLRNRTWQKNRSLIKVKSSTGSFLDSSLKSMKPLWPAQPTNDRSIATILYSYHNFCQYTNVAIINTHMFVSPECSQNQSQYQACLCGFARDTITGVHLWFFCFLQKQSKPIQSPEL